MKNCMISIALAAYNGSKYIREQLDSILSQTYQNFELIVCDDCSTDNTWQILEEYAAKDIRIKIFKNEKNLGFKKNFEKTVSLCSGQYIALSDQDDIWLPDHLELLLSKIDGCTIACGNAELVSDDGTSLNITSDNNYRFLYKDGNYLYMLLLRGCKFQGALMLLPSEFAKKVLPIPERIGYHDMWFAACACMENGINYSTEIISKYRVHSSNVTEQSHYKYVTGLVKQFFSDGIKTEAFAYCDELRRIYGFQNAVFNEIYDVIQRIKNKRLSFGDIKFLWKNFYDISGKKSRLEFIPSLLVWKRWKE